MTKQMQRAIRASDARIQAAVGTLQAHPRGQQTLAEFKRMVTGPAGGLDTEGMKALQTLLAEFAAGRRDFLNTIPRWA